MTENLTGAPTPFTLNGREYKSYEFRDVDHDELSYWARKVFLEETERSTSNTKMLRVALQYASTMHWLEASVVVASSRGIAKLASIMCRTEITPEEIRMDPGNVQLVWKQFEYLHPNETKEKDKVDQGEEGN